jgi:hypothetical protein
VDQVEDGEAARLQVGIADPLRERPKGGFLRQAQMKADEAIQKAELHLALGGPTDRRRL